MANKTDKEKRRKNTDGKEGPVYQVRITLDGIEPPIFRVLQVFPDMLLPKFHRIIQAAMGWSDEHLHKFKAGDNTYGVRFPNSTSRILDEKKIKLNQILRRKGEAALYEYDFGDSWRHEILLEAVLPQEKGKTYPVCVDGARACPPEDCGGIFGYAEILEALKNPEHPRREFWRETYSSLDPERFDLGRVNRMLEYA
jgi:hypothetical protein